VAADYTRTIVFKVEDKAIKRATDRITNSLQNIENILGRIERKGLKTFAASVEDVSSGLDKATKKAGDLERIVNVIDRKRNRKTNKFVQGITDRFNEIPLVKFERAIAENVQFAKRRAGRDLQFIGKEFNRAGKPVMELVGFLGNFVNLLKTAETEARKLTQAFKDSLLRESLATLQRNLTNARTITQELSRDSALYRKKVEDVVFAEKAVNRELLARKRIYEGITKDRIAFNNKIKSSIIESKQRRASGAFSGGFAEFSRDMEEQRVVREARRNYKSMMNQDFVDSRIKENKARRVTLQLSQREIAFEERLNRVLTEKQTLFNKLGFGGSLVRNEQGMFASPGGRGGRIKGALQSGMIGGGFPLLFGQGGGAALAGGVGGTLGGALSPGFGFAGSIVATAIASAVIEMDKFNLAVSKVNAGMEAMGYQAGFSSKQVKQLAKTLKISKEEALEVLNSFSRFGPEIGAALGKFYGQDSSALFAIGKIKDQQSALQAIMTMEKKLTLEDQAQLINQLATTSAAEMQVKLTDLLIKQQFIKRKNEVETVTNAARLWYWTKKVVDIAGATRGKIPGNAGESPGARRKRELSELNEEMDKFRSFTDAAIGQIGTVEEALANLQIPTITGEVENLRDEIKKLLNPVYQLTQAADAIGNAFGESFKGIVSGSMTAQDALRNLFQRTADHFLDMAAQIMAAQIKAGIMGMFNFGANPVSSTTPGMMDLSGAKWPTGGSVNYDFFKASGGPVKGGSPYVVGEKGPELFVPNSHGSIVPNDQMGGANIVVNVDASGSSVEGDAGAAQELGDMLAAAIQAELVKEKRPGGLLA